MHKNRRPILVTGSHRSGTTWIGRTISQHPKVRYEHEPYNVNYPNCNFELKLNTWFSHFESSSQKKEITVSFQNLLHQSRLSCALKECKADVMSVKTPLRFIKYLVFNECPRILVKDPLAILSAGWMYETYHFQVICMIRSPFAFVASLKSAGWDFDFEQLCKQDALMAGWLSKYTDSIEYMCMHKDSHDLVDRASLLWNILHFVIIEYKNKYRNWLFIKHEDIAVNPVLEFKHIFNYLGLEMNTTILNYIEEYTGEQNSQHATNTSYQPRNSKLVLQSWKARLSQEEINRIKSYTDEIFKQLYDDIV